MAFASALLPLHGTFPFCKGIALRTSAAPQLTCICTGTADAGGGYLAHLARDTAACYSPCYDSLGDSHWLRIPSTQQNRPSACSRPVAREKRVSQIERLQGYRSSGQLRLCTSTSSPASMADPAALRLQVGCAAEHSVICVQDFAANVDHAPPKAPRSISAPRQGRLACL